MQDINLAKYIDHTLLKPDATAYEINKLCEEAVKYGFATVCVNPIYTKRCADNLLGTDVGVCTVVGFPLGANTTASKVFETKQAIEDGAREVDMVLNIAALKNGIDEYVEYDIFRVVRECNPIAKLKVIIETCLLNEEEKIKACEIVMNAGADFVKTSTGFSVGGATVEDIRLMKKTVGNNIGIKASGGIRDYKTAIQMIQAGATRIGSSSSINIVNGG